MRREFDRRLRALEEIRSNARRFPSFVLGLMRAYATDEEYAAWEAHGVPEVTPAEWDAALERAYAEKL